MVETKDKHGRIVPIRALLDTGTSSTMILRDFVPNGQMGKFKRKQTSWSTLGGNFQTRRKAIIDFKFPELDMKKSITWNPHVDEAHSPKDMRYDMIIGMDLMTEIGIFVDTAERCVVWGDHSTPLREYGDSSMEVNVMEALYHMSVEPPLLQRAKERQKEILDADYSQVDITNYVDGLNQLNPSEKASLKQVLSAHPTLFGGGLGKLKIKPVHLELKEEAKPHHSKHYPIPRAYERVGKKEIQRLVEIGVLERNSDSPWAAATFFQPKKTEDVRVLTDF
jgi:hypothetical protein